jgi:hypothetical protein
MDGPTQGKQLVKDGVWCVPPEERPKNWATMPVREPVTPSVLDQVVTATEERGAEGTVKESLTVDTAPESVVREKPTPESAPIQSGQSEPERNYQKDPWNHPSWLEIRESIHKSAVDFSAGYDLIKAAMLLVAGMFTRTGPYLRKMAEVTNEKKMVERCYRYDLWNHDDMTVTLGEMTDEHGGDLELWLNAMVVNGILGKTDNETFYAIEHEENILACEQIRRVFAGEALSGNS